MTVGFKIYRCDELFGWELFDNTAILSERYAIEECRKWLAAAPWSYDRFGYSSAENPSSYDIIEVELDD